jgi:hypothetical protein
VKIWYLIPLLILAFGCATVENNPTKFEGKPMFDLNEVQCPSHMIKFCTGRFHNDVKCQCVYRDLVRINGLT